MTVELAHLALMLALSLALVQAVAPIWGAARADAAGRAQALSLAVPIAVAQSACVTLAFAGLLYALGTNDFSLRYVAEHSNRQLPLHFRLSAAWAGHEGSLLLWLQMLALWTLALVGLGRALPAHLRARVLGVLGMVSAAFISFSLLSSDPFERLAHAVPDGRDLNPLLQDPGMIFHPPLLYMGYVGFSVAFAFAVAALLDEQFDPAWARWARPWTLAAWGFLTLGILLGSFWAYYELGWGGWWFWDAVENASFMPWLAGTALIHSLAVSDKRGGFRHWTLLLAIACFSLSLLGTFLVRSGVLSSVHAFASDPRRGLYILALLSLAVGASLALFAWRAPRLARIPAFSWLSRESLLLLNNLFLLVSAATILLGTLYPMLLEALHLGSISVGPPYFETVFVPLMLPLLALLAVAPFTSWKQSNPARLWFQLWWPLFAALTLGLLISLATLHSVHAALGLCLALWMALGTLWHVGHTLKPGPGATLLQAWHRTPRATVGMWTAHLGLALFVLGVSLVRTLEYSQELRLGPGQAVTVGDYQFRLANLTRRDGPNYLAARADIEVRPAQEPQAEPVLLHPEKRFYTVQSMPMTEAGIDRGFGRDLYVSLAEVGADQSWGMRIQVKPFMSWLWCGVLLMALGGFVAAADRRLRWAGKVQAQTEPSAGPPLPLTPQGARA